MKNENTVKAQFGARVRLDGQYRPLGDPALADRACRWQNPDGFKYGIALSLSADHRDLTAFYFWEGHDNPNRADDNVLAVSAAVSLEDGTLFSRMHAMYMWCVSSAQEQGNAIADGGEVPANVPIPAPQFEWGDADKFLLANILFARRESAVLSVPACYAAADVWICLEHLIEIPGGCCIFFPQSDGKPVICFAPDLSAPRARVEFECRIEDEDLSLADAMSCAPQNDRAWACEYGEQIYPLLYWMRNWMRKGDIRKLNATQRGLLAGIPDDRLEKVVPGFVKLRRELCDVVDYMRRSVKTQTPGLDLSESDFEAVMQYYELLYGTDTQSADDGDNPRQETGKHSKPERKTTKNGDREKRGFPRHLLCPALLALAVVFSAAAVALNLHSDAEHVVQIMISFGSPAGILFLIAAVLWGILIGAAFSGAGQKRVPRAAPHGKREKET